jgi:lipopolysaccharide transport system ATP-binding protein
MQDIAIKVQDLSKQYRLGNIGTGSISHDLNRWWYSIRGKDDPYIKIGDENERTQKGKSEYVWALKNLDFQVERGEVLGIIGRNGAGKSTLLKILSRTTAPTKGEIKIKGRVASLLEVGTGFHPELSGRENIYLNGAILGMSKSEIKSKFDEIVDFSGVERYIDTPVKRYSSGMYVRLAFAVAAHLEPDILIVDEVLAVGDAEFQKKCLGKMKEVSVKGGRTILFVSHNLLAVQNLCSKGIMMKNGVIAIENKISDVIQYYNNEINVSKSLNLGERIDRSGTGELKVSSVELRREDNVTTQTFASGENVKIILFCKNNKNIPLRNVVLALGIDDMHGTRITYLDNQLLDQIFNKITETENTIEVTIRNLPLMPGKYDVTIFIEANAQISDWIQNAFSFVVEPGDFYKTGKLIPEGQGTFLMNYSFKSYGGTC